MRAIVHYRAISWCSSLCKLLSFIQQARWMEEWPRDILSAQSLNVVMLVPSDLPRAIQDFEKWEMCFADLGEEG